MLIHAFHQGLLACGIGSEWYELVDWEPLFRLYNFYKDAFVNRGLDWRYLAF